LGFGWSEKISKKQQIMAIASMKLQATEMFHDGALSLDA
jgi:hypothetical protein